MSVVVIGSQELQRSLSIRDLTDPEAGPHAIQLVVAAAIGALERAWGVTTRVYRDHPVVRVADNYDALGYPADGAARDARYTRYVTEEHVLRTQTTAMIPPLLARLAASPPEDVLLACPGIVYRRDTIDRLHCGEPHQLDLWRVARRALGVPELREMASKVAAAIAPGREVRLVPARHPYTRDGLQIDVAVDGIWIEIGECGVASSRILAESGLAARGASALAMGIGLDRCVMIAKGIPDIRALRSADPRVARQMLDLDPWVPVSSMPPVRRDLSIAIAEGTTAEEIGDRVRASLGERAASVEEVAIVSETREPELSAAAIARIGLRGGQKNVLLRVVLRDLERTLTHDEANGIRDTIWAALHEGTRDVWARGVAPGAQ